MKKFFIKTKIFIRAMYILLLFGIFQITKSLLIADKMMKQYLPLFKEEAKLNLSSQRKEEIKETIKIILEYYHYRIEYSC